MKLDRQSEKYCENKANFTTVVTSYPTFKECLNLEATFEKKVKFFQ